MMLRYIVPLLLFAAAGYVWHYNDSHSDSYMLLPLLDFVPSLKGNIPAQADWSWKVVAAIGAAVLVINVVSSVKTKKTQDE